MKLKIVVKMKDDCKTAVIRSGISFEPSTAEINFNAGAIIFTNDEKSVCGIVFDENIDIKDLSDDDLAFRAKCRSEWVYPEFDEVLKRAGIDPSKIDDGGLYEQAVYDACKKLDIDVFLD